MTPAEPPVPQEQWLDGGGGRLLTRHWRPAGPPRAALVICHGVNSHGGQYAHAGAEFAAAGFAVTALDLRGRGRSEGKRYWVASIDDYVDDLSRVIDAAKARDPGLPCFLLGHSAGGVTATTYALDHQDSIDARVCESFAFRVFAPNFALTLLKALSHVVPDLPVLKLPVKDFSRDSAWVAQLLADPLTLNEKRPVATVAARARAADRLDREFGRIRLPVLILHGTADKATHPDCSQQFLDQAGSPDKRLILYEGHAHDLLNDLGRERVMADVIDWLEVHLPPARAE